MTDERRIARRVIHIDPDDVQRVRYTGIGDPSGKRPPPIFLTPEWGVSPGGAIPSDYSTFDERVRDIKRATSTGEGEESCPAPARIVHDDRTGQLPKVSRIGQPIDSVARRERPPATT